MASLTANPPIADHARLSLRIVFISVIALWLCYFLIASLRAGVAGIDFSSVFIWRRALVSLIGVGVTIVFWLVLRLADARPFWVRTMVALLAAIPAALFVAQANYALFASVRGEAINSIAKTKGVTLHYDRAGNLLLMVDPVHEAVDASEEKTKASELAIKLAEPPSENEQWRELVSTAFTPYFMMIAWAAIYLALLAGAQARYAERRAGEFARAAKIAELRSLRYQVNPHFLFNTLNSLSALVITGKNERAEDMIQSISRFYRNSLAEDPTGDVSLEHEFALQRYYLDIEAQRFPDRMLVRFELPESLKDAQVLGMILQPLVENSVKYGVAPVARPVTITIAAWQEGSQLVLSVCDDGRGTDTDSDEAAGFGIGLANVAERIQARFGRSARIVSGPRAEGGGYCTDLYLPLVKYGI